MLASLSISNFALIDKLGIDFSDGFSIITGETGAGKSILLGALGLVLGKRADLTSLKNKEEKCVIEAHFQIANYNLQAFFDSNDLDYEDETIIRREILPSGKSRAFINDSPVNLQELQDLSVFLIDIHSQHQTQELSEELFQFQIIDSVAENQENIHRYSAILSTYKKDRSNLATLTSKLQTLLKEQDYNTFLLDELLAVKLKVNEQEELEQVYEQLNNVEFIKENLDKSLALANEEQFGILQNLKEIKNALQKTISFSPEYQSLFDRINSVTIEFDDIISELSQQTENLVHDPENLELVNQKLQNIYNLQKKHQVNSIEELLEIQNDLDNKVVSVVELEFEIKKLADSIEAAASELDKLALNIRNNRLKAVPVLSEKLIFILEQLGMPNVRFNMELKKQNIILQMERTNYNFCFLPIKVPILDY